MRAFIGLVALALLSAPALADDAGGASAEQGIRDQIKDLDAAWAKHDAKAVAAMYTTNGDIVTADGQTLNNRDGIEQALSDGFANQLSSSTLNETVDKVRLIKPDVAIVDISAQLKGADQQPSTLHVMDVMVKHDGKWEIETSRAVAYAKQ